MSTDLVTFNPEQLSLIKKQLCPGITDEELQLFAMQCRRTGLDPFAKQVYAVKRWDSQTRTEKMAIQYAIDGFRVIAERNGKYAGQLGPFWCGPDGIWKDVWLSSEPPVAARVGVMRSDFKEPLWGVAKYDTYVQRTKEGKITRFWFVMPEVMIAKCAESIALRRAFPQDLAGCYTSEEMGQADNDQPAERAAFSKHEPIQPVQDTPREIPPPSAQAKPAFPYISAARTAVEPDAKLAALAFKANGEASPNLDEYKAVASTVAAEMGIPPGQYTGDIATYEKFIAEVKARSMAQADKALSA